MDYYFPSKKHRIRSLLESSTFADCTFVVARQEIKAHRLILTLSSPVFERMFYGRLASDRVEITDITPEDFREMLDFIYNDSVRIESAPKAWALFYAARKYMMSDLADVCATYVAQNLTISNLCLNYEYADLYGIVGLKARCLTDICDYIRGVFLTDYHMKAETLARVLAQGCLVIAPAELGEHVVNWAAEECERRAIFPDYGNIVDLLGATGIGALLAEWDLERGRGGIVDYIRGLGAPKRRPVAREWSTFCVCRQTYKIASRVNLADSYLVTTSVSVDRNVLLFGVVVLPVDEAADCRGRIGVRVTDWRGETTATDFEGRLSPMSGVYVPLKELVAMDCDRDYEVRVSYFKVRDNGGVSLMDSTVLCYYMGSKLVDEKRKAVFTFRELRGGFIKGLCYYPS